MQSSKPSPCNIRHDSKHDDIKLHIILKKLTRFHVGGDSIKAQINLQLLTHIIYATDSLSLTPVIDALSLQGRSFVQGEGCSVIWLSCCSCCWPAHGGGCCRSPAEASQGEDGYVKTCLPMPLNLINVANEPRHFFWELGLKL